MSMGSVTFLYSSGVMLAMGLVFWFDMRGWIAGAVLLFSAWVAIVVSGAADPGLILIDVAVGAFALWLSMHWCLRHRAWQARSTKDHAEAAQIEQQNQGAVQHLKVKIIARAADVDKSLKQYDLVRRLAEALSWEEMSPALERAFKNFFKAEGWALYLTDTQGGLQLMQKRGTPADPRDEDLPKQEPYLHTYVVRSGSDQGRTVWSLGMPLWRLHERIGLLLLRITDLPADQQPALLSEAGTFAVQLIFAMAKAKLFRELNERSRTDGLTGLSRRGPFEERLKEEVARAQSFKSTFSILMIDIDHFKNLNDTYGHQVGDEVLKTVSQRLREGLYETDLIARYGGEEFICLLPRSDPAGLRIKAEQLRQRVGDQAFVIGLEAIQVTVSIGIAHFPRDGKTSEAVLGAADRALYAAKHAGRNRVIEAASVA